MDGVAAGDGFSLDDLVRDVLADADGGFVVQNGPNVPDEGVGGDVGGLGDAGAVIDEVVGLLLEQDVAVHDQAGQQEPVELVQSVDNVCSGPESNGFGTLDEIVSEFVEDILADDNAVMLTEAGQDNTSNIQQQSPVSTSSSALSSSMSPSESSSSSNGSPAGQPEEDGNLRGHPTSGEDSSGGPAPAEADAATCPCYICGAPASPHVYYGGRSACKGCRAFFRRAVACGTHAGFTCAAGTDDCAIDPESRRKCQRCRFRRCLEAGMRTAYVRSTDDGSARRDTRRRAATNRKRGKSGGLLPVLAPFCRALVLGLTSEERAVVMRLEDRANRFGVASIKDYFKANPKFAIDIATLRYLGGKINMNQYNKFVDMVEAYNMKVFTGLDEMRKLLAVNGPIAQTYKRTGTLADTVDFMVGFGISPELDELCLSMKKISLQRKPEGCQVAIMPHGWAADEKDAERHEELRKSMLGWKKVRPPPGFHSKRLARIMQDGGDSVQFHLLEATLAFSADFVDGPLDQPDKVQRIQHFYATLLRRYLKEKYGPSMGNTVFVQGLMVAAHARETNDIVERNLRRTRDRLIAAGGGGEDQA